MTELRHTCLRTERNARVFWLFPSALLKEQVVRLVEPGYKCVLVSPSDATVCKALVVQISLLETLMDKYKVSA